jgi:hypothetical protein
MNKNILLLAKFPLKQLRRKPAASHLIVLLVIASFLLALPRQTQACGPFFTDAIFVYTKHPDMPLDRFAQGQLGVLQTTYARSYLFVAYRNLIGASLSSAETAAVKSLWDDRLSYGAEIDDSAWVKTWTEARSKVPGIAAAPEIKAFRNREKPHEYESFLNCQQDAFENAAATLNDRAKRFGADNAQLREWISAQDAVFANCSEGKHVPDSLSSGDALARADRAYQIAAANFYAGNFDEAAREFDAIAKDANSPWHERAPYLAARSLIRKASFAEKEEDGRPALSEAETRLKAILGDKELASSHHAATRLLNLVRLRLHPKEKLHELAHSLVKRDAGADFKQDVWDYTVLMDKALGDDEDVNKKPVPADLGSDEMTDWIVTFQNESPEAASHSLERWDKTKAAPWLLAAISKAGGQQSNVSALLGAAAKVEHASPAFASVAFHSVRLLMEGGRRDEARKMLDSILASDRPKLPPSAINVFLGARMTLSQNLEEFLQTSQRVPAGFSDDNDGREIPEDEKAVSETTKGSQYFFDVDAANVFNKAMTVDVLRDAALSKTLAANLRRDVTQAAFLRAALTDDSADAERLIVQLGESYPEVKTLLASYQHAATPDAKKFAAAYLALKFPGLRPYVTSGVGRSTPLGEIDSYRDNWWCAEAPVSLSGPPSEDIEQKKAKPVKAPDFLTNSQTAAAKQVAALQGLGTGPNYLCRVVIDWANKNGADPRVPEALHLAVKSTRYGCTDKETGRWSKAAFDLLHARYPNSTWAKQTKYWFNNN